MNVRDAIHARRAVKQFDAGHELTDAELHELLEAITLAPTAFNIQNRHAVVVRDPDVRERLQAAAYGQTQVRDAAAVLVLTGDLQAHTRTERFLRHAPDAVRGQLADNVAQAYAGDDGKLLDEANRSIGMAAMSVMLTAKALGYDSCPMGGFDPDAVSDVLGLDDQHPPLLLLAVGRRAADPFPRLGLLDLDETVSRDRLGEPWRSVATCGAIG